MTHTVGDYRIIREIGRGSMGIVYEAHQPDLDRLVALKGLHAFHSPHPELVRRFLRESELAGSLNHPNIITIHRCLEDVEGGPFIAMEYLPRGSLRPWVGNLSLAQLAGVMEGLLAGLTAVEPSGTVHRDLKPENVLVTDEGRVKITDFGVAKAALNRKMSSFMTSTGAPVGTPAYMAPEQALSGAVGPRTDLYSVGVMAYEHLVGHVPFHNSHTSIAMLVQRIQDPIPPISDSRPDLDLSLSNWVASMLAKDPDARPPSAAQAWEHLEEIVLELLGPRWRRDARLSEHGSTPNPDKPLPPAPFASPDLDRVRPSTAPEYESRFFSFGRAHTGLGEETPPDLSSPRPSRLQSTAARSADLRAATPLHEQSPPRRRSRAKGASLIAIVTLAALVGAIGFLVSPTGGAAQSNTRTRIPSSSARTTPSPTYARAMGDVMLKLNSARVKAGSQLARAKSTDSQAAAARELARAHTEAAAAVQRVDPGPSERAGNRSIVTALSAVAIAYTDMSDAADRVDRGQFDRARHAVETATTALTNALGRLRKLGYRLGN